jgi:hypothetical protein
VNRRLLWALISAGVAVVVVGGGLVVASVRDSKDEASQLRAELAELRRESMTTTTERVEKDVDADEGDNIDRPASTGRSRAGAAPVTAREPARRCPSGNIVYDQLQVNVSPIPKIYEGQTYNEWKVALKTRWTNNTDFIGFPTNEYVVVVSDTMGETTISLRPANSREESIFPPPGGSVNMVGDGTVQSMNQPQVGELWAYTSWQGADNNRYCAKPGLVGARRPAN